MTSLGSRVSRVKAVLLITILSLLIVGAVFLIIPPNPANSALARTAAEPDSTIALVPSTPNDFILPGTQPNNLIHKITPPQQCKNCHAGYAEVTSQPKDTETWTAWSGSMMSQAGRDPIFLAGLDIANADAAFSGEFCLRCHMPRGWLDGRSVETGGSLMTADDREGVQCAVCHRLIDPVFSDENPERDAQILADLNQPVSSIGSGAMIVDPEDYRRGPFDIVTDLGGLDPHKITGSQDTLVSPYHREAAFCGSCHDITNPLFTWSPADQEYKPNPMNQPGDPANGFPIEKTYSEWRESAFNSQSGIYAPQFGGNKPYVSTCQDCHMRSTTGAGGAFFGSTYVIRNDMPLHDLTGANTWVPQIIPSHPVFSATFDSDPDRLSALASGIDRARYMLQNAAVMDVFHQDSRLYVTIYNKSGHKLPSGYVEGRRMWLQIDGYNAAGELVFTSGNYDQISGILQGYHSDPNLKVYEAEQGLTENWANQIGLEPGPSFHFILNNQIVNDNRIPPQGFNFNKFLEAGAAPYKDGHPDATIYADGQSWDTTVFELPEDVTYGKVRLLHQIAAKEYIEFLRENNPNPGQNNGKILYDLWQQNGRSKPEVMAEKSFTVNTYRQFLPTVQRQ